MGLMVTATSTEDGRAVCWQWFDPSEECADSVSP